MTRPDLEDYVPVSARIEAFKAKYPEGSLQSEIVELTDKRVTIRAFAYRHPGDSRPGIGLSSLAIPGATPFTRGSELENAETSAWGRALAALGFEVRRGIASAEERRNQSGQGGEVVPASPGDPDPDPRGAQASYPRGDKVHPRTPAEEALRGELAAIEGMTLARLELLADAVRVPRGRRANEGELRAMLAIARQPPSVDPAGWPKPGTAAWRALSAYDQGSALAFWAKHDGTAVESPPAAVSSPDEVPA